MRNKGNHTRRAKNPEFGVLVGELLETYRRFRSDSKTALCARLAKVLELRTKTVVMYSNGRLPGEDIERRIRAMHQRRVLGRERQRPTEQFRAYVPCPDAATLALINRNLPANERWQILAAAAENEELE
jgi:hypothetical protein